MDYVVFGIGFGATILVLGLLLRDLGPRLRYRNSANSDGVLPADQLVAKVAWNRYCSALGAVLGIGGSIFLLLTFVSIVLRLSDGTGGRVMLAALGGFFLLMLSWTWAFFDRFGSYGILPERPVVEEEPQPAPEPEPQAEAVQGPGLVADTDAGDQEEEEHVEEAASPPVVVGQTLSEVSAPEEDDGTEEEPGEPDEEAAEEPRLATPEERLAEMEEPLDHGSAAGDLDTAPAAVRRPGGRERSGEASVPADGRVREPDAAEEMPDDQEDDDSVEVCGVRERNEPNSS